VADSSKGKIFRLGDGGWLIVRWWMVDFVRDEMIDDCEMVIL